jgi:hypothetical protein
LLLIPLALKNHPEKLLGLYLKISPKKPNHSLSFQFGLDDDDDEESSEKLKFNAQLRIWLAAHPQTPIRSRQSYNLILRALRMKASGEEFSAAQMDEYNLSCRYSLQDDHPAVIVSKASGKQIVSEADVYDIMMDAHLASNHGRRDTMCKKLGKRWGNFQGRDHDKISTRKCLSHFKKQGSWV